MNACTFGAAVIFAALWPSTSRAADDDAAALVLRGVDRYRREDYEGARTAFARAYELAPSTRTLFNLALAELQSGHFVDSIHRFRAYLVELDTEPDKVEAIKTKWLPRAEAGASRLQVDAPVGAEVVIDGNTEGRAPLQVIDVAVGDHDVVSRNETWSHAEHVVTRPGELYLLHFENPASVQAQLSGLEGAGAPATTHAAESRFPTRTMVTEIALLSGAAVAAGLGVGFAIASNNEAGAARDLLSQLPPDADHSQCLRAPVPVQCPRLQAHNRAAIDEARVANGLYVGAGLLAGAAVVAWFAWPRRASPPAPAAVDLVPVLATGHAGLAIRGAW